jgi:hypothetical protein
VWSKTDKILRPVKLHELFLIWDYEGKMDCKHRSFSHSLLILRHRVLSPLGKIVRAFAFGLLQQRNTYVESPSNVVPIKAGKSEDIPFSPLEVTAEVRAEAACPDDANIDLSTWVSTPTETSQEADAHMCLRRVAVKWWSWHHVSTALKWLSEELHCEQDHAGVKDCIFRIKACRYFKWPRGSRIFFSRIPRDPDHEGWFEDFSDGVKLCQLPGTTLPQGRMPNIPSKTREDELLTREKIL